MRKTLLSLIILSILLFTACTEYVYIFPVNDNTITSIAELRSFLGSNGSGKAKVDLSINPETDMMPIAIRGTKELSGNITLSTSERSSSNIKGRAFSYNIFEVLDGANVTVSNFIVDVMAAVEQEIAIFSIGDATVNFREYSINTTTGSTVIGIYISADTKAENIGIETSNPGTVYVDADNPDSDDIITDIGGDGTEPSIPVITPYDASDAAGFFSALDAYGKVRLTENIMLEWDTIPETWRILLANDNGITRQHLNLTKSCNINLNGHELTSSVWWNLVAADDTDNNSETPTYEIVVSNGILDIDTGTSFSREGTIKIRANAAFTLDDVHYETDSTGFVLAGGENTGIQNNNMKLSIINESVVDAAGIYGISTNASEPVSENVVITIDDSRIQVKNSFSTVGILFNIPGTLTITDSTIYSYSQTIIARGGTHNYTNANFISEGTNAFQDIDDNNFFEKNWGTGNEVPLATLVVGNRSDNSYTYPTDMTLKNVSVCAPLESINTSGNPLNYYGVYIYQNNSTYNVKVRGDLTESPDSLADPFINIGNMNDADITELNINYN